MRPAFSWLILAGLFGVSGLGATPVALAQDVLASPPVDVSVTVYRDPDRNEGGFDLNNLNGFALITETRRVKIAPGQHRLPLRGRGRRYRTRVRHRHRPAFRRHREKPRRSLAQPLRSDRRSRSPAAGASFLRRNR